MLNSYNLGDQRREYEKKGERSEAGKDLDMKREEAASSLLCVLSDEGDRGQEKAAPPTQGRLLPCESRHHGIFVCFR